MFTYQIILSLMLWSVVQTAYPRWPQDFRWSSAGPVPNWPCVQILELAEPSKHTWYDNFMCWKPCKTNPSIRWNSAGPINGMRCTRILETADPHTWHDNYLCVPHNSPYYFLWSSAGPISGWKCLQWHESADPHTWNDNYLCGIMFNFGR